jgi:hypothetical protein
MITQVLLIKALLLWRAITLQPPTLIKRPKAPQSARSLNQASNLAKQGAGCRDYEQDMPNSGIKAMDSSVIRCGRVE